MSETSQPDRRLGKESQAGFPGIGRLQTSDKTPCSPWPADSSPTESFCSKKPKDIDAAEENGLNEAMTDRLRLTHERIDGMVRDYAN